jgi:aminoglycoside phosphotransferase (APT) family kinase protein
MALWRAERVVTPEEVRELLADQFPQLHINNVELLGSGWDNTAYLVNSELVFRFPRRQIAVKLLELETNILPKLQGILPLDIPNPMWVGKPSKNFEWPFYGYEFLSGDVACSANLSREERIQAAKPLAEFLRVLHSVDTSQGINSILERGERGKLNSQKLQKRIAEYYTIVTDDILDEYKPMMAKAVDACQQIDEGEDQKLVHGDYYSRHILIGPDRRVSGIIDWGDVMIADPAEDLSVAFSFLPMEAHATFRESYGPIAEDTWLLARMRGAFYGIALVAYAFDMKEPEILQEGLNTLAFVKEAI